MNDGRSGGGTDSRGERPLTLGRLSYMAYAVIDGGMRRPETGLSGDAGSAAGTGTAAICRQQVEQRGDDELGSGSRTIHADSVRRVAPQWLARPIGLAGYGG